MRLLPVILLLSACAQFPALDNTQTPGVATAPYPRLVPFETLLEAPAARATPEMREGVLDRADSLRERAGQLTGPVVDEDTQERMRQGIPELPSG